LIFSTFLATEIEFLPIDITSVAKKKIYMRRGIFCLSFSYTIFGVFYYYPNVNVTMDDLIIFLSMPNVLLMFTNISSKICDNFFNLNKTSQINIFKFYIFYDKDQGLSHKINDMSYLPPYIYIYFIRQLFTLINNYMVMYTYMVYSPTIYYINVFMNVVFHYNDYYKYNFSNRPKIIGYMIRQLSQTGFIYVAPP
ncbi:hypothetical protein L9F63_020534, partial [Diploptera punctata]